MSRDRFGEFHNYMHYRTREDREADAIRAAHEDPEEDCFEDCPLCLEQNEPVSLCCGEPAMVSAECDCRDVHANLNLDNCTCECPCHKGDDICSFCKNPAVFKIPVKGF